MGRLFLTRCWRVVALALPLSLALPTASATSTTAPAKPAPASNSPSSKTHTQQHATSHAAGKATARTAGKSRSKKGTKKSAKKRGQQVIDPSRAREIQEALIREHYLDGEPSGTWDNATQSAMQRYQQDRGWQSKTTPDSRALIKLGLGPSHEHLLNPESAMTTSTSAPPAAVDSKAAAKQAPPEDNIPKQ